MDDLLAALLEVLTEALLELLPEILLSLAAHTGEKVLNTSAESSRVAIAVVVLLLGAACGVGSVGIFPHPLVHPSKFRGISLIVSPVLAGLVMSQVGRILRRRGKRTIQLESFAYGFAFAFIMAAVRLVFVK